MERLKALRIQHGLLQKEIAEKIGVDRTTYVKYENGSSEPNLEVIQRIADNLDCSVDYLLGRDVQQKEPPTVSDEGFTDEQKELIALFEAASPAAREAALTVLRLREAQDKARGTPE